MNINSNSISCIILAGGRGKRLNNQDKGLIKLNGIPLIEHVITALIPQVDDIVISANRNINAYKKYSSTVIDDGNESYCGPLAGIASTIAHCQHEWIVVVPCDMPLLPADLVSRMQEGISGLPDGPVLSIAETLGRPQLVLFMHRSLLASLERALAEKQYKLMEWVKSQNSITVHFQDDTSLNNVNTAEQLSRLS